MVEQEVGGGKISQLLRQHFELCSCRVRVQGNCLVRLESWDAVVKASERVVQLPIENKLAARSADGLVAAVIFWLNFVG